MVWIVFYALIIFVIYLMVWDLKYNQECTKYYIEYLKNCKPTTPNIDTWNISVK